MSLDASTEPTLNGPNSTNRDVKKRASQACHHCRTRKVKCDLTKSGIPCHNCSSDGIECVILESRRSRKYRLQKRQLTRLVSLPPISQAQPRSAVAFSPPTLQANSSIVSDAPVEGVGQVNHGSDIPPLANGSFQSPPATTPIPVIGTQSHVRAPSSVSNQGISLELPAYIRPSRPDIRSDDVEFLARRGALSFPSSELRDQLIRCFVLYVYPFMPIVDLEDFIGAIDGNEAAPKLSLITFQAILFSATAFVDLPLLQEAGYENRRAARADYYQKVKLLYDFDWDVDRLALIQSLLMLNYWYVSENDQKDPWHWLGICVSLATSIGLNQQFTYAQQDQKTSALWRRIWWCCLYRDKVMSISMRRPMRIQNEDIKLPLLRMDDFEITPVFSTMACLRNCAFLNDGYTRTMLAEMFMAYVKLIVYIGQIIKDFYHLRGFGGSTAESTMLYTPRRTEVNSRPYQDLQNCLDQWYRDLPPSCWLVSGNGNVDADTATTDALIMHRSVLRMLFLMATEALNRPQSLSKPTRCGGTNPTTKVREAAENIAEMVESMQDRDLIRFLPPLSVSFLLLALASFLVDIKTKGQTLGALAGRRFHVCIRALLRLREIWPIADSACFLIGQMITKNQVGKISTPGIQPQPMDAADAPTNVWRDPGPSRPNTVTTQLSQPQQMQSHNNASLTPSNLGQQPYLAVDKAISTPGAPQPIEGLGIPYNWTEEDFERDYGPMIEAHALNMDLAMPDADVLEYFENGTFDFNFEPSPHQDYTSTGAQDSAATMTRGTLGQDVDVNVNMMADGWNPVVASQYIESLRTPRSI